MSQLLSLRFSIIGGSSSLADLIAIPDFAAGAMENWGLITYRMTTILYDDEESSVSNKQWVAVVIAHELAHQVGRRKEGRRTRDKGHDGGERMLILMICYSYLHEANLAGRSPCTPCTFGVSKIAPYAFYVTK